MLAKQGKVDAGTPAAAMEKYQLLDVNAGTSGAVGGAE
jgi:pyruvate dehydrogenase E1 component